MSTVSRQFRGEKTMKASRLSILTKPGLLVAAGALVLSGAGCGASATSPTPLASQAAPGGAASTTVLTSEVVSAMDLALQDEYHAEAVYERVLMDFGSDTWPFDNILGAEERHSAAIVRLYANRSLPVAASQWNVDNVPRFDSVLAACVAGVDAERANIAVYDQFQSLALPTDVEQVFSSNRAASLLNHLPAFERCASALGG